MTETIGTERPYTARSRLRRIGRRWPTALGLAAAAASAVELVGATPAAGVEQAVLIALPVLVYLTAAVTDRPRSAWPVTALATAAVFVMAILDVEPVLGVITASTLVLVVGLIRRLWGGGAVPATGQLVGAVGFATAAVLALYVAPTPGAFVVGFGLLGHATWDVVHYRRDIVVVRSLAEFCAVLDVLVGAAVIALAVATAV